MKYLILILTIITSCGIPEFTPWSSQADDTNLTDKNISRLPNKNNMTIALTGDPQVLPGEIDQVRKTINNRSDIDFVVVLGDLTDRGLLKEWKWFGKITKLFNQPVLTVIGNHDGLSKGKKIYKKMFGSVNYSFMVGRTKFIMWNNNPYEYSVDMNWLRIQSEYYPSIIMSHQPPYNGSLNSNQENEWYDIRHNGNIIASVHGHMHRFGFRIEGGIPIYTVERVPRYGIMVIKNDEATFQNCHSECKETE